MIDTVPVSEVPAVSEFFGGGVAGYREFLLRTEGAADPVRSRLERREQFFDALDARPLGARYRPDREVFLRNLSARRPEPGLSRRMLWLLATTRLNQAERFGVGLGAVYGKGQEKFESEPEHLYVLLQEHYHTRLLADVVSMFGLPFPTVLPLLPLRATIRVFVALPGERTLPMVGASEMIGCVLFRALRDEGVALFADDPPIAERIGNLYDEILADEIGHVGYIAAQLSPRGRSLTRFLARHVAWRSVVGSIPELDALFTRHQLKARLRAPFDIEREAAAFPGRAYAAAAI